MGVTEMAFGAPRAERGDALARETVSLDGEWRFRTEPGAAWRKIQVPGCWESQMPDLQGWAGSAIYERGLPVPESWRGRRIRVRFGAVDYFAETWVNGRFVGKHEGGYTPFAFDVTDAIGWNGDDVLTIRVTDATPEVDVPLPDGSGTLSFAEIPHGKQSWYTPISGIWQPVSLEARAPVSIEHLEVRADVDRATARVLMRLTEGAAAEAGWRVRLDVRGPDGGSAGEQWVELRDGRHDADVELHIPEPLLWSPEAPHLYRLEASLHRGEEAVDSQTKRFGFRKIETRDGHIWLNGAPFFVIGALDQAFYPKTIYTAPSEEYLRDQFRKAKEMGLNLMRCHIKVPSPEYLDLCDEMGLLVWYEIPNGSLLTQGLRDRLQETFLAMLERDRSHPSIVIMSLMNESWGIDLSDLEQRQWLTRTFHWAKQHVEDRLIVDNSACIPNFHLISDLDDYHVYYNVPDQAAEFAEWVQAFADRDAGSYSGFGDATRHRQEPLLISEFGNWGLPRLELVEEAEGGVPWWFTTGEGITRPAGAKQRFEAQKLARAFGDWNGLAASSQEQEWIALKFQIEEMRRRREVSGYVITEFTDINWEVNGLLDFARNPKVFHQRLADLQQQDILIPRANRHAAWPGDLVEVGVELSKFSRRETEGARLEWNILGIEGSMPIGPTPAAETTFLGAAVFHAPEVERVVKTPLEIALFSRTGEVIARTQRDLVFAPSGMRHWGEGRQAWLHDPLGLSEDLGARLAAAGFEVLDSPRRGAIGIVTQWDNAASAFVQGGGTAVLAALHAKSLLIASGLGLRLLERTINNWWGDWCSSHTWLVPEAFPYLPDTGRFDFEYEKVVPKRVLLGGAADQTLAGLFVGWLRNPGAYAVRTPVGGGRLVATTFDVITPFGTDPIATLMLRSLVEAA